MRRSLILLLAFISLPAAAAERRCGWFINPTPQNFWLLDREREWTLSEQGDAREPIGWDKIPDMSTRGWVHTNGGSYGYGCACMTVETDRKSGWITKITAATPRPLLQCRADRRLGKP